MSATLLLSQTPPKDGDTLYACGFHAIGSWAGRLEQHKAFCKTEMGKYILALESERDKLKAQSNAVVDDVLKLQSINAELLKALKDLVKIGRGRPTGQWEAAKKLIAKFENA